MTQYWVVVFTGKTWDEFLSAGGEELGFRERRKATVGKMEVGDRLMCYVSGVSRWIGVLEVVGPTRLGGKSIFTDEAFPVRLPVKVIERLQPSESVPMTEIMREFSWWDEANAKRWGVRFQCPPSYMKPEDGKLVEEHIKEAKRDPRSLPVDPKVWSAGLRIRK